MKISATVFAAILLYASCESSIKNPDAVVEIESGTVSGEAFAKTTEPVAGATGTETTERTPSSLLGAYVGDFEPAGKDKDTYLHVAEGAGWNRANKINLSIDRIDGDRVYGHSVVAGNDRPFEGSITEGSGGVVAISVREPGDDRHDGAFTFEISGDVATGTWRAFRQIEIPERKFVLSKQIFVYDPDVSLKPVRAYIDWGRKRREKVTVKIDGEVSEWMDDHFASATEEIYAMNASNTELTEASVENLKRGDLVIIRNTIYARHGYSFRARPLRIFFDAQPWYIPVHADITSDFTPLELSNIKLLLRYEQNAAEYYDRFGRG